MAILTREVAYEKVMENREIREIIFDKFFKDALAEVKMKAQIAVLNKPRYRIIRELNSLIELHQDRKCYNDGWGWTCGGYHHSSHITSRIDITHWRSVIMRDKNPYVYGTYYTEYLSTWDGIPKYDYMQVYDDY